jgi:hypothetical protein
VTVPVTSPMPTPVPTPVRALDPATAAGAGTGPATHYLAPDWLTRAVVNRLVARLTRLGVSLRGSRLLEHRGRVSGRILHTPVNLLTLEGTEYLVAPRGDTQWVRNVRHSGGRFVLILGRRRRPCSASEVPAAQRVPVLRAYLDRWGFETSAFFGGLTADSSDEEIAAAADRHPVFALA